MMNKTQEAMNKIFEIKHPALSKEVPIGYKRTEIGVIPEEWSFLHLGTICDVRDGTHESPRFYSEGVPFITSKNIVNGSLDLENISYISEQDADEINKRSKVDVNDILMSMIGTIGSAVLIDFEPDFCIKNVALIKPQEILPTYLIHLIASPLFQNYLTDSLDGGIQKFVALGTLRRLNIPFPPSSEQRAIAEALSDVDGLLAALEALITKKRAVKQAAMQQLLTGKTRLPGFSGKWETKSFDEVFKRLNAKAHHIQTSEYSTHGLHPVIDQGQAPIVAFSDQTDKLFECLTGGVIVFGDHTRIVKFININFLIGADGTQLLAMQKHHAVTKFFFYQLLTKDIPNTGYNRHFKFLQDLTFEVPTSAEQKAIASVLSDMDAEIAALEKRRDKARAIKQGMMQQLLTGRVRLVKSTRTKEASAC